jgi:hypothetical protein
MGERPDKEVPSSPKRIRNRRRSGRLFQESLASNFGPVIDVSTDGVRIRCHRIPNVRKGIELHGLLAGAVRLQCEIAWTKRVGLFTWEVGIRLLDLDDYARRRLRELSLGNKIERAYRCRAA